MEAVLAGGGKGGQGPAVKGIAQAQDPEPPLSVFVEAVFPGQLDGAFVGLRARIAEENPPHAGRPAQLVGKGRLDGAVVQIGDVLEPGSLLRHRRHPSGIAVAQGIDPDAAAEIDIFLPVHIHGDSAAPAFQGHGKAPVGGHQRAVMQRLYLLVSHAGSFFLRGYCPAAIL